MLFKMNRKLIWSLVFLLFLAISIFSFSQLSFSRLTNVSTVKVDTFVQDTGKLEVHFCPQEDCEGALVNFLDSAESSIHCALFEIDLELVKAKLLEQSKIIDVKIVTDDQYLKQFNHSFVKADSYGLMHNKFCVIDGKKVSMGSMNPTDNCAHKNNNNLLLIESLVLAGNYEQEFQEMWNGIFKKGETVENSRVVLKSLEKEQEKKMEIENYFCPEDHCAERVKDELKQAKESIYFMTFSFTHEGIANILLLKHLDGLEIKGVMEAKQISDYSVFQQLEYQGINVLKDGNKYNLHHKVFIIDEETVITGSFNPTAGGDEKNDENLLIIHDAEIAREFLDEFERIWPHNH